MNLIEGLQKEMNRVRGIIQEYDSLPNNAGAFASSTMKKRLEDAENAIATDDLIEMINLYAEFSIMDIY